PTLPVLEVLEQEPRAPVTLAPKIPINKVLIDAREDETARCEQLAEIAVPRVGVVEHVVVAVDDQHEPEGAVALPIPHARADRHLVEPEAPFLLAGFRVVRLSRHEWRDVDGLRLDRDRVAVFGATLVGAATVVERLDRERAL